MKTAHELFDGSDHELIPDVNLKKMNTVELLEEIKNDYVGKFDNDPIIKRVCNVVINEYKNRIKELLSLTADAQRELLNDFLDWEDTNASGKVNGRNENNKYITDFLKTIEK